jgi:predicted enzyme related to lactoylglutathione lyase
MAPAHGKFVWHELATRDTGEAQAFYAQALGWTAQDCSTPEAPYSVFVSNDIPVAGLVNLPSEVDAAPHWLGYVDVEDVEAAVAKIKQLSGAVYVPPKDVPGVSRFSIVADPQMATLALIERLQPSRGPSGNLGVPGAVGWNELLAADWETAFAFYQALFGWRKVDSRHGFMGVYQTFAAGAETVGGMFTKPPTLPQAFWLYYFNVDDIDAAARRVEAAGGEIYYGPVEAPGGACILHCADAQGATFALLQRLKVKPIGYSTPRPSAS